MVRAEQTKIGDAIADAERRLSMPLHIQVKLGHSVVAGISSVLGKKLRATREDLKTPAPDVNVLDLYGQFWNAAQEGSGRKPRAFHFSDDEITYISGLSSSTRDLTEGEKDALRDFSDKAKKVRLEQEQKKEEKTRGSGKKLGRRSISAWWDLRW